MKYVIFVLKLASNLWISNSYICSQEIIIDKLTQLKYYDRWVYQQTMFPKNLIKRTKNYVTQERKH